MCKVERAERLQTRADAAAASAAEAAKHCEAQRERAGRLRQRAQSRSSLSHSASVTDQCHAFLTGSGEPQQERCGERPGEGEEELLKRLAAIEQCRGGKSCNCLRCWEQRAQARRETAESLRYVAEKAWQCTAAEGKGHAAIPGAARSALRTPDVRQVALPDSPSPVFSWAVGEPRIPRAHSASALQRRPAPGSPDPERPRSTKSAPPELALPSLSPKAIGARKSLARSMSTSQALSSLPWSRAVRRAKNFVSNEDF